MRTYVRDHHEALNRIPSAFLSVSLTAAADEPKSWSELEEITTTFLDDTGWRPNVVERVAGALLYSKYNFMKKFIMRLIARRAGSDTDTSQDREYTDWDQVRGVLQKLEAEREGRSTAN